MATDLAALMGSVAREILGEPNERLSSEHELRYGTHGSLSIDLRKGVFFDNESKTGGGVLDFVGWQTGAQGSARIDWLRDHGFPIDEQPVSKGNGKHAPKKRRTIVATYDYTDEAGNLLFQAVRWDPKQFSQRRPDGKGGWLWNLDGVRRVPYRLRELQESIAAGETVFICEGEKDVDRLRAEGVAATTAPMGAGKWPEGFAQYFELASCVVILPDNDEAGRAHAAMVGASFDSVAEVEQVVVLELPNLAVKQDVSDWYEQHGGTTDKLFDLVQSDAIGIDVYLARMSPAELEQATQQAPAIAALPFFDASEFDGVAVPERRWLVQGRIPMRNVTLLSGDGAVGKTTIALQLAASVAVGRNDWLGALIDEPGPVLFYTAEEERDEVHYRINAICRYYQIPFATLAGKLLLNCGAGEDCVLATVNRQGLLDETPIYKSLRATVERVRPKLVVIESAADVFGGGENDRAQVRQFVRMLRAIAIAFDCAVLLLTHPSVAGMASGKGTSGTTAWNNSVRSRLYFTKPKAENGDRDDEDEFETDERVLEVMKANFAAAGERVSAVYRDGVFVLPSAEPAYARDNRAKVADDVFLQLLEQFTASGRPVSPSPSMLFAPTLFARERAAKALKLKAGELREAMSRLLEAGRIETVLEGPPSKRRPRLQPKQGPA